MTDISAWILSVAGICFVSVVIDLVLPEGKTNSYIKRVVSYAIILVVILPIPKIINGNMLIQDIFYETDLDIQEEYIHSINQSKLDALTMSIEKELIKNGFVGTSVSISANIFERDLEIYAIYVDLYNLLI